jgi:hypothetical protein
MDQHKLSKKALEGRFLWEGKIEVGSTPATFGAVPTFLADSACTAGTFLTNVKAQFQPSH